MHTSTFPQSRIPTRLLFVLLACLTLLNNILAAPLNDVKAQVTGSGAPNSGLGAQVVIMGVVLIIGGLLFVASGYRLFKLALFLGGFWFFGKEKQAYDIHSALLVFVSYFELNTIY